MRHVLLVFPFCFVTGEINDQKTERLTHSFQIESLVRCSSSPMASILKLQVITGAYHEGALAYLLQTDDFRFLLDCGWDENFSMDIIEEYKRSVRSTCGFSLRDVSEILVT